MGKNDDAGRTFPGAASRIKRTLTSIGKRSSSVAAKAAAAAAAAASKENLADAPIGAVFKPTPKEDWGSAVVRSPPPPSPRAIDRARAAKKKRADATVAAAGAAAAAAALAPRPPPSPSSLFSPEHVRSFDWDHEQTLLDGWTLAFNGSRPLQLTGKVFNNAGPGLEDGDAIEYTSQVVGVKGRVATTKSGTKYYLGEPSADFEAVRVQLVRETAAAEHGPVAAATVSVPFDAEKPFGGIDLGPTVACSSVKLPSVKGWTAESNVALLHEWTLEKSAAGYNMCIGARAARPLTRSCTRRSPSRCAAHSPDPLHLTLPPQARSSTARGSTTAPRATAPPMSSRCRGASCAPSTTAPSTSAGARAVSARSPPTRPPSTRRPSWARSTTSCPSERRVLPLTSAPRRVASGSTSTSTHIHTTDRSTSKMHPDDAHPNVTQPSFSLCCPGSWRASAAWICVIRGP